MAKLLSAFSAELISAHGTNSIKIETNQEFLETDVSKLFASAPNEQSSPPCKSYICVIEARQTSGPAARTAESVEVVLGEAVALLLPVVGLVAVVGSVPAAVPLVPLLEVVVPPVPAVVASPEGGPLAPVPVVRSEVTGALPVVVAAAVALTVTSAEGGALV